MLVNESTVTIQSRRLPLLTNFLNDYLSMHILFCRQNYHLSTDNDCDVTFSYVYQTLSTLKIPTRLFNHPTPQKSNMKYLALKLVKCCL